ncbi:hypothetical protein LJC32_03540, partial [Oscillospiraceae bacterium OttesenSCG-928-F05]|nr:hypothetical protein [Oscillospiraceae bacterium OttesenSCG-928-F05]
GTAGRCSGGTDRAELHDYLAGSAALSFESAAGKAEYAFADTAALFLTEIRGSTLPESAAWQVCTAASLPPIVKTGNSAATVRSAYVIDGKLRAASISGAESAMRSAGRCYAVLTDDVMTTSISGEMHDLITMVVASPFFEGEIQVPLKKDYSYGQTPLTSRAALKKDAVIVLDFDKTGTRVSSFSAVPFRGTGVAYDGALVQCAADDDLLLMTFAADIGGGEVSLGDVLTAADAMIVLVDEKTAVRQENANGLPTADKAPEGQYTARGIVGENGRVAALFLWENPLDYPAGYDPTA